MKNKILKITSTIYLILVCVILPLYMEQGYYKLGEAKGKMYIIITGGFVLLSAAFALPIPREEKPWQLWLKAALLSLFVTLVFSVDKKTALLGLEGWRTGFLTLFLMLASTYILSKGLIIDEYVLAAVFITPFLSFVLGILGRFGIYVTEIYANNGSFLATLGNIDWYTGFLAVFVSIGTGLGYSRQKKGFGFICCNLYTLTGLLAVLLQGAESALLVIAATYGLLLYISLSGRSSFNRFLLQLGVLGLSMELAAVLLLRFGDYYNYESNLLTDICLHHVGLVIVALSYFVYRLSALFDGINVPWKEKIFKRTLLIIYAVAALAAVAYALTGNIKYDFGNGRLFIWQISGDIFMQLPSWQKLFGVGQDCFYTYAYHNPMWTDSLLNILDGDRLTNAHCEPLTVLIERGIVGAVTYYGFIGSSFYTLIKKERAGVICALPIAAYFFNSLVSFATPISTTYLFVVIGVGMSLIKAQEQE